MVTWSRVDMADIKRNEGIQMFLEIDLAELTDWL